jgi:NADH:ubiquinone oxidoreductase subunit F (NADH-binding)
MTQLPYLCADCGNRTANRNLLCDGCQDDKCGKCLPCTSGLTHIAGCYAEQKEAASAYR